MDDSPEWVPALPSKSCVQKPAGPARKRLSAEARTAGAAGRQRPLAKWIASTLEGSGTAKARQPSGRTPSWGLGTGRQIM